MITPETLSRHELAGLQVRVAAAANPSLVGIEGRVVDETTRTLVIEPDGGTDTPDGGTDAPDDGTDAPDDGTDGEPATSGTKQVPKDSAIFEFRLSDEAGGEYVTVEGEVLVERPARRTERRSDSTWR